MKPKVFILILALVLCACFAVPALAAETLANPQTFTISIPEAPGVTFIMEGIYDEYISYAYTNANHDYQDVPAFVFFYTGELAVTCNMTACYFFGYNTGYNEYGDMMGGYSFDEFAAGARVLAGEKVFDLALSIVTGGLPETYQSQQEGLQEIASIYFVSVDEPLVPEQYADYAPRPITELTAGAATPPSPPAEQPVTTLPTTAAVLVNGRQMAFEAYNIGGNNYFKLRDIAHALSGSAKQFEVEWDSANNAIALIRGKAYTTVGGEMTGKGAGEKTASASASKIMVDGQTVQLAAYNIEGNNYFKLRDIGRAFDFGVNWGGANNTIIIDTSISYTPE